MYLSHQFPPYELKSNEGKETEPHHNLPEKCSELPLLGNFSLSLESPSCWFYSTIWHFGSQFKVNSWVYGPSQTGFTLTPTVTQAREISEVLWLTCCHYISITMLFRDFYFPSCCKPVQRKSSRILSSCKSPLLIFFSFLYRPKGPGLPSLWKLLSPSLSTTFILFLCIWVSVLRERERAVSSQK